MAQLTWSMTFVTLSPFVILTQPRPYDGTGSAMTALDPKALKLDASVQINPDNTAKLELVLRNTSNQRVRIVLDPFSFTRSSNFVFCRDGNPMELTYFVPLDACRVDAVDADERRSCIFGVKKLQTGHYDMVGLLFCEVENSKGVRERIPLPIEHVSFDVP